VEWLITRHRLNAYELAVVSWSGLLTHPRLNAYIYIYSSAFYILLIILVQLYL
jgi:hypothetical protein